MWNSIHSFLARKSGDIEDHCVLLVSLLLGFGLDAYIAIGQSANGPHTWVITRNTLESNPKVPKQCTFWESITGQRISVSDPKVFRFYKNIHCVFNNTKFYANIQADDTVFNTNYNFEDQYLWKGISSEVISSLVKYDHCPNLDISLPSLSIKPDVMQMENKIEAEILHRVGKFRKSIDLSTQWDKRLGYVVNPALVNYEFERTYGSTFGNDEFKQAIKNYIPEGFTFKAFPLHCNEISSEDIFSLILSNDIGKDILYTNGDSCRFAIRCKIFPYPHEIYSLWFMIAVKFRQIK